MAHKLLLTILTPEKSFLTDKEVDFVTLPAFGGEMGILPGHISLVTQLKEGILTYKDGHKKELFAVLSGFAEVNRNSVLVLAEEAELAKEINEESARQAYQKAKDALAMRGKDLDLDAAQAALRRAVVRLKISELKKKYKS
ncbi:MAG: ATP synthase F1 subunit epsilon [Elusimicrobia bacterium GWA2_56_46]|nr:MAG: ATP synthase F1 subunit epsilon [Elusimicrobia bacterium GWA2_56_46]OGR53995.1 MAG: ATP synthase F1 subunit epsilon [Elusimicrobia bacterium GWC2_56_31]HBB67700.1 ATP synthase F1 subunit epsilon [Elusimicrobiota bacterium]HBW22104.1 ATP synthase F1 subunit epsilon [Elusimicrobiota bacterium]